MNLRNHFLLLICLNTSTISSALDLGVKGIIHYYNTESNWERFVSTVGCSSGKSLGKLGKTQEMTLPNETLIIEDQLQATEDEEWKMARVVWPDELRRYSEEEVINRAKKR